MDSMDSLELLLGGVGLIVFFLILLIGLLPYILYLLSLQKALKQISPEFRQMSPGDVWLLLIPLFNLVYHFIVVRKIADSFQAEFSAKNYPLAEARPTYNIGMAMCILVCCSLVPILGIFAGLASLVCWIMYWVKVVEYKNKLQTAALGQFDSI